MYCDAIGGSVFGVAAAVIAGVTVIAALVESHVLSW